MGFAITVLCSLAFVVFSYFVYRGTVLDISPRRGLVWAPLYYKTIALILVPLVMVQYFPLSELSNNPPPATPEIIGKVTVLSMLSILIFTIILAFFLRVSRTGRSLARSNDLGEYEFSHFMRFGCIVACLAGGLFVVGVVFLGHQHALVKSIVSGENLLSVRLANRYASSLPSQAAAFFSLAYKIVAITSGVALALGRRFQAIYLLLVSLFFSSIGGDKAPLVTAVIFFVLSYVVVKRPSFNVKTVFWYFAVYPIAVFVTTFFITSYQIPDLDFSSFVSFVFGRLGFGQMAGTFNTFSIPPLRGDYFYHVIPFASLFVDYPIYQKDLMVYVMNVDYESTGMQNSLFISEAFGIGGWPLLMLSPFIVGATYFFGLLFFYYYMRVFISKNVAGFYSVPLYVSSMDLTGGFSSFAMFKAVILFMMILLPVVFVWRALLLFSRNTKRVSRWVV